MIYGLGNDIIEIERIEKALEKKGFREKIYTSQEINNIISRGNRIESYAGVFSAKEAISKSFGSGIRNFSFQDIEIINDELGKPIVRISAKLDNILREKFKKYKLEISISHSKKYATAIAIFFND